MHTAYFDIDCGKMGKPTFRVNYIIEDSGVILDDVCFVVVATAQNGKRFEFFVDISNVITDEFEQYIIGLIRGEM